MLRLVEEPQGRRNTWQKCCRWEINIREETVHENGGKDWLVSTPEP